MVTILFTIAASAQDVYVLNAHSQLEPATRAVTAGFKTKGNALLTAYGGKLKTALLIEGKSAELTLPLGATYFYIHTPKTISIKTWKLAPVESKKKERELIYSKTGLYTGTKSDVDEIELTIEKYSDNIYFIKPKETLMKGEYVLFRMETGVPAEVYDFRIDPSLSPALQIPSNELVLAEFNKNNKEDVKDSNADENSLLLASSKLLSDVDTDIPVTKEIASKTFALIISNENYKQVENVPFALNDGRVFKQYLQLALGLPEKHITHLEDASLSDIKFALNRINEICEAYDGQAKIIVHYSGHGIPSESSMEGYILPIDGYSSDVSTSLKVSDLYTQLSSMKSTGAILFLDACFSGTQKSGEMLASARGVSIKVKQENAMGNLIVVSAAQGDQTAYPYSEKQHGLMTYFLLKKLQESKGEVALGELTDYITTNVKRVSLVEQGKSQVPSVSFDPSNEKWREQSLK